MKKIIMTGVSLALIAAACSASVSAEEKVLTTNDALMTITLPDEGWYQITSDEDTEMFSDGDCAIKVKFYENGATLPAIESADANHEMIYTAAASTQEYVMHVVGYVHQREDFSGVCKAINSIRVDSEKVNSDILISAVPATEYGIIDQNYVAYVSADELNVRNTTENGSIVSTLYLGEPVTVTGSVTRGGKEIGWARIKTGTGVDGYVSTQFLNTKEIAEGAKTGTAAVNGATRTGYSMTLTADDGSNVITYQYTDGVYRDDYGNDYTLDGENEYTSSDNDARYYYNHNPEQTFSNINTDSPVIALGNSTDYDGVYAYNRTGNMMCLQSPDGEGFINIYEDVDGRWWDINGIEFVDNGGSFDTAGSLYSGDYIPTTDWNGETVRNLAENRIDVYLEGDNYNSWCSLNPDGYYYNQYGQKFTDAGDGTFVDEYGNVMVNDTPNY